jgi:hypothetical protein
MLVTGASGAEATASNDLVTKSVLDIREAADNLLQPDAWRPWQLGFERDGTTFVCNNGDDRQSQRGASQSVVLNQTRPEPIVAVAWSKAEGVTGTADTDYSLYLDLVYNDGTPLWGQTAAFATGSHDWQRRRVVVFPEKPVRSLSVHLLLRGHGGKASFRDPVLHVLRTPESACLFDGVPVVVHGQPQAGFQVRDVAAGSDFVRIGQQALGLELDWKTTEQSGGTFIDAEIRDTTGRDRAITLIYAVPVDGASSWLNDPRTSDPIEPGREYVSATRFHSGLGRLSRYPLAAVVASNAAAAIPVLNPEPRTLNTPSDRGVAVGIDMAHPAFYRVGYNVGTRELFAAYDIGLAPEKPKARVRLCRFSFEPAWGFRAALAGYYGLFPDAFRCGTPEQGLWMPFAPISKVEGWQDFGFKFKEGNDETAWDDAHGITTFRYTEPMTWWMSMPNEMPRTLDAALAEARRRAEQQKNREARALLTSGYHNEEGQVPARLLDTPWCNGAVWSMNSMPGIAGDVTDFKNKWNPAIRDQLYGPSRKADLDGEYVDSSEGYVTDELDFCRDHFAAADTPLTFSPETHKPAIFRGLIAFEYVRGLARDVHGMDKLMMANGAPGRLCWLAPLLEVLGTETDWNPGGQWRPMSDGELLYRRALCKGKPYCFLMNTEFERFSPDLVERYMKRSLAYGMFPGFFSHNASEGQYFTRPELYNRDRPLFKKYVPLCKRVAEAGWEPMTRARSSDEKVYVERFGDRYLTVFNDSSDRRTVTIRLELPAPAASRELVTGKEISWNGGATTLTLAPEDIAVFSLSADSGVQP